MATGLCGFLGLVFVGPAVVFPKLESGLAAASTDAPSFSDAAGVSVRWNGLDAELLVPPDLPAAQVARIAADLAALDGARSVTVSALPVRPLPESPPQPQVEVEGEGDREAESESVDDVTDAQPVQQDPPPDLLAAQGALESAFGGPTSGGPTSGGLTSGRLTSVGLIWRDSAESDAALARLAGVIGSLDPRIVVELVGHTDADGEATANLVRSQQEAASLLQELVARGVDPSRLEAFGQGEAQLLVAPDALDAATLNHRIELVLRAGEGRG